MSLADFADWFEDGSSAAYDNADLREAWIAVDAAFSAYHYDNIGENALKAELENAIRPFANISLEWNEGGDAIPQAERFALCSAGNANVSEIDKQFRANASSADPLSFIIQSPGHRTRQKLTAVSPLRLTRAAAGPA
jgi:hypothetical protein